MNIFHTHRWTAPVDRHQSCQTCGLVRVVECAHEWGHLREIEVQNFSGVTTGEIIVLQCKKCGKLSNHKIP